MGEFRYLTFNPPNETKEKLEQIDPSKPDTFSVMSDEFMGMIFDTINWLEVLNERYISPRFLSKHFDKFKELQLIYLICGRQKLDEQFLNDHCGDIPWETVFKEQKLSQEIIDKFSQLVNISTVLRYQTVTEDYLYRHIDRLDWRSVWQFQQVSELFIRNNIKQANWQLIVEYQNLSDEFIEEFQGKMSWYTLVRNQKLSYDFIMKHSKKVEENYFYLQSNPKYTDEEKRNIEMLLKMA